MLSRVPPPFAVSASGGSASSGTVVLSNLNGLTFGQNGNTITGSYTVPSTAGLLSNFNLSAGTTSQNLSNLVFSNSNGLAFGLSGSTVTGSYTVPTVTAGSDTLGMSNLGNTSGTSGVVSGDSVRLLFAGGNNVTLSQSLNGASGTVTISAANQTVQTQNLVDVTLAGNTSGALALISSGTLTLAGGNNITLSQAGNAVTISGGAGGGFSAGVSTGGNTQGNTGITGTRLVLVGNPNITLSQNTDANGATITFSGGAGAAGNTGFISAGAATASLGTVVFSNSNGVSFGVNGQTVTGSVAAQSNQTVGVYGSSQTTGSASSGTYDARSLSIIGAGIISVGNHSTSAGGTTTGVVITATQSNQAFSASGGSSAFQTLSFNNANGFTFSNVGGAVQGSYTVPTVTNSSWTVSDSATSATVGRLAFTASNGLTLTLSTSNNGNHTVIGSYTVPTVTAGSDTFGMSNLGNTAGTSGVVSGDSVRVLFAGGNNVTLSQSVNGVSATITISGANTVAQTNQSAIKGLGVSNTGNTAGNTGLSTGIDWVVAGSNGVTASQSTAAGGPNTIWISGVTTAAQTNQSAIKALGASNTGNTAGNTGVSTGIDWVLAGTNGVTISESTVGGGPNTLWVSGVTTAAQTNQSAIKALGVSNTGNTLGNTGVSTGIDWVVAASGAITASESTAGGGPNTVWLSVAAQTVESQSLGMSNLGNTSGTTGMASGGQVRFAFAGGNNITLSQSLNGASGTITISAPNLGAGAMSVGVSNLGNTAGATGVTGTRLVLVGTNGVTLSQTTDANGGTVSFSAGGGGGFSAGVSTGGNTAGSTGVTGTQLVLVATNALTLSQSTNSNGGTITFSAPATSSLSGTGNISIVTNGSTISIGGGATLSQWDHPGSFSVITNSTLGQNTVYLAPFDLKQHVSAYRINFFFSVATAVTASNATGKGGYTFSAALYQRDTGTNSTQLTSFWSGSFGLSMSMSSNTSLVITNLAGISNSTAVSTVATTLTTSNATTYPANSIGGFRCVPLPISSTLAPAGDYWLAVANSSSNGGGTCTINCSVMQHTVGGNIQFRPFGTSSAASNASFYCIREGFGTYSATTNAFPGTIPLNSDSIRAAASATMPFFNFSGYTTATNML